MPGPYRELSEVPQTFANSRENSEALYIGDGAYAAINKEGELVLTTENGIVVGNRIVIERHSFPILEKWIEMVRRKKVGGWTE